MDILLDTCAFIWIVSGSKHISKRALDVYSNPDNKVYLSVVSVWEMAIKQSIGRLKTSGDLGKNIQEERSRHGVESLSLDEESAGGLIKLPSFHSDPFDRMLICQAISHGLAIITPDKEISRYPVKVIW